MESQFNILWLDDEEISSLPILEVQYPDLRITKVGYIDECSQILLDRPEDFHAVILDANGINSTDPDEKPSKRGLQKLIRLAKEDDHLPVYIYSGKIQRGNDSGVDIDLIWEFFDNHGFEEDVNIFYKSYGPGKLLDRVSEDLKEGFKIFDGYPELKDLVLHYGVDKMTVKQLLEWMQDPQKNPFPSFAALRRILIDDIRDKWLKSMFGIYASEQVNFQNVNETCMHQVEAETFRFCGNLLNKNVHNWPEDSELIKTAVANSFIVSLNWFCRFRKLFEKNPNPSAHYKGAHADAAGETQSTSETPSSKAPKVEVPDTGIVEKDRNGFYTVNGMLLTNKCGKMYEGREVKATGTTFCRFKTLVYNVTPVSNYENRPSANTPFSGLGDMIKKSDSKK